MIGKGFGWLGAVVLTVTLAAGVSVACKDTKEKGGLMLAMDTDMRAPKDVNVVGLTIQVNGQVKYSYLGRVAPDGKVSLPATVALTEPSDPDAVVRIRAIAFQETRARVLRDVRTKIPTGGRIALLRLPFKFVDDQSGFGSLPVGTTLSDVDDSDKAIGTGRFANSSGSSGSASSSSGSTSSTSSSSGSSSGTTSGSSSGSASGSSSSGSTTVPPGGTPPGVIFAGGPGETPTPESLSFDGFGSKCDVGQHLTSIDGECKDDFVDSSTLPDYTEEALGKNEPGSCFDVNKAFGEAAPVDNGQKGGDIVDGGSGGGSGGNDASAQITPDAGSGGKDFHFQNVTLDNAACALNLNGADASKLNIAIVTSDTGECIRPGECYIPIDSGDGGWTESGGRVTLPKFVCTLLGKPGIRLATSLTQPSKKANNPICTAPPGEVSDGGPQPNNATRVIAQAFATTVRVPAQGSQNQILYFAAQDHVGSYALTGSNTQATAITFTDPPPGGQQPWFLTPTPSAGTFVLTTETGQNAWVLPTTNATQLITIPVGQSPINNGFNDQPSGVIYWSIGGKGGGVYQTFGTEPTAATPVSTPQGPISGDIVAVLAINSPGFIGFLYVDSAGNAKTCNPDTGCVSSLAFGSRTDDFALDPRFAQSGAAGGFFVVTKQGIRRLDPGDSGPSLGPILAADTGGLQQGTGYYRRGVATANNHGCFYFSSSRGIEWSTLDFAQHDVLVPLPASTPALGVATGGRDNGKSGSFIYYAVFAAEADGGGIWQVPPPPQCPATQGGGDGGTSGLDGGGGMDSGTMCSMVGGPCEVDQQCCAGLMCNQTMFMCFAP